MSVDYALGVLTGLMLGFPACYLTLLVLPDAFQGVRLWRRGRQ